MDPIPQPGINRRRWPRFLPFATLGLILGLAAVRLDSDARRFPPHLDEAPWILSGLYYWDLAAKGDFTSGDWERPAFDSYGSINPFLGRCWIAGAVRLSLGGKASELSSQFSANPLRAWIPMGEPGSLITPSMLLTARRAHAVLGLLCLVMVFIVARQVAGEWAGGLAGAGVALLEPFYLTHARVFTDGAYLTLTLVVSSCLIKFASSDSKVALRWLVGAGAAIGCAFNVKMTALALGLGVMGAAIFLRAGFTRPALRTLAVQIASGIFAALLLSIALNPYLWPTAASPRGGGTWRVFTPMRFSADPHAFSPHVGAGPVSARLVEMHFRWHRQMLYQVAAWPGDVASKRRIVERLLVTYNHGWLTIPAAVAALAGAYALIRQRANRWRPRDLLSDGTTQSRAWAALLGLTAVYVGWSLAMIPLDWDRYYLPAVLHLQIAEACLIVVAIAAGFSPGAQPQ